LQWGLSELEGTMLADRRRELHCFST
jgi:hypothetical protein